MWVVHGFYTLLVLGPRLRAHILHDFGCSAFSRYKLQYSLYQHNVSFYWKGIFKISSVDFLSLFIKQIPMQIFHINNVSINNGIPLMKSVSKKWKIWVIHLELRGSDNQTISSTCYVGTLLWTVIRRQHKLLGNVDKVQSSRVFINK